MKFCSECGATLVWKIPEMDDRKRYVCEVCPRVHYQNPNIVTGCIPEWEDRILLCRRAIEPRRGYWTLPAGFMELGETVAEGAMRESWEEANARVHIHSLYTIFDVPHAAQVFMMFRARLLDTGVSPGQETLELDLFQEDRIPWADIAFTTVLHTLEYYFADRRRQRFLLHTGMIYKEGGENRFRPGNDLVADEAIRSPSP